MSVLLPHPLLFVVAMPINLCHPSLPAAPTCRYEGAPPPSAGRLLVDTFLLATASAACTLPQPPHLPAAHAACYEEGKGAGAPWCCGGGKEEMKEGRKEGRAEWVC